MSRPNASTDPLFFGDIHLAERSIPRFTSGRSVLDHVNNLLVDSKDLREVVYAPEEVLNFFDRTFPELVESNQIGKLTSDDFEIWKPEKNHVTVEVDTERPPRSQRKDVYIGGPAALFAAALDANSRLGGATPAHACPIMYGHNGSRGASNWKGSASYYHIIDTVPVYYWADNTGPYVVANTLRNHFKKTFDFLAYRKEVNEDANYNVLKVNFGSIMSDPGLFNLCFKNFLNTLHDVGLPLTRNIRLGPLRPSGKPPVAYTTLAHGHLTGSIMKSLPTDKPLLIGSNEYTRSLRVHAGKSCGNEISGSFEGFKKYCSKDNTPFRQMHQDELAERGYDTDFVTEGGEFPDDGYFPAYINQELEEKVKQSDGGEVKDNLLLKTILVSPTGTDGDCKVTRIIWQNTKDGGEEETAVNELYLSLGPSAEKILIEAPKYDLRSHLLDVIRFYFAFPTVVENSSAYFEVYQPNLKSFARHAYNQMCRLLGRNNLLQKMMHAAGLSCVLMVKLDPEKVPAYKITKFRDHINSHNQHVVRLGEKLLVTGGGKRYHLFALQLTAGGNFPNRYCHPEAVLNVLKARVIPLLGLGDDGIEFDIVSARSCARGVTSQNVFRVTAPFRNMVQMYGLGGIGMTTMAPNAVLMKAVMESRKQLADGKIAEAEFYQRLQQSNFGDVPGYGPNPFSRDYATLVDNARDPRKVCRQLGVLPRPAFRAYDTTRRVWLRFARVLRL